MESKGSIKDEEKVEELELQKISHPLRVFIFEAILFLLTAGLSISVALKIMKLRQAKQIPPAEPVSLLQFIGAFALATVFILLMPLFFKKRRWRANIFKGLFVLTVFLGGVLALGVWFSSLALLLMLILILAWLKFPSPLLHNLCLILAMAGLGATLALSLTPLMVVAFLVLFSIYDFIAVYKTKHMIRMAKEMMRGGAIMGFVTPQRFSDLALPLKKVKMGGKFLILGGGDVVFPLLLVVSLLPQGIFPSLVVVLFALLGILASFLIFINQKVRAPIPALPPIAFFSILGYLLTMLF